MIISQNVFDDRYFKKRECVFKHILFRFKY